MHGEFRAGLRLRLAVATLVGAVSLSGACGGGAAEKAGSTSVPSSPPAMTQPATTTAAKTAERRRRDGPLPGFTVERSMFRANCAACHTLADARARGTRAGGEANLDEIRPNSSSVRRFATRGYGAMPSFRGRLSAREIAALARYVATADGCGTQSATACDAE